MKVYIKELVNSEKDAAELFPQSTTAWRTAEPLGTYILNEARAR